LPSPPPIARPPPPAAADQPPLPPSSGFGDLGAVRAFGAAGANVEQTDRAGYTPLYAAAAAGSLRVVTYLVDDLGADQTHDGGVGALPLHMACGYGHTQIVCFLADRAPQLVEAPDRLGMTPLHHVADGPEDRDGVVSELIRRGCARTTLARDRCGRTALDMARHNSRHDLVHLLEDVIAAGGYRKYVATRRMAYVRIRHEVSKTYKVLPKKHEDRELFQFVFGRNRDAADEAETGQGERPMRVLPTELFIEVCKYLGGLSDVTYVVLPFLERCAKAGVV